MDKPWELTDEEIDNAILRRYDNWVKAGGDFNDRIFENKEVAQAAQRKLWEWQEEHCTNRNHNTHDMPRRECKACLQALRQGMETP